MLTSAKNPLKILLVASAIWVVAVVGISKYFIDSAANREWRILWNLDCNDASLTPAQKNDCRDVSFRRGRQISSQTDSAWFFASALALLPPAVVIGGFLLWRRRKLA
jgi:hypothetical protein